jgi:hypothetical protein
MNIETVTDTLVNEIISELKYEKISFGISDKVIEMIAFNQVQQQIEKPLCELVECTKNSIMKCLYDDNIN